MLLDRAAKLQAALASHQTLKLAGQQGDTYQTRARQLKPLADGLARAKQDWKAAADAGLAPGKPSPTPGLKAHAAELLRRFRENPQVLAEPDDQFRFQFTPGLKKAAEELDKLVDDAWSARVNVHSQFPAEAVLRALEQIPAYRVSVQRIRDAASDVQRLKDNRPPAAELKRALAQLDAAITNKDDAIAAMQGDDLPAEVQAFLRKTGQGGAEISDLTTGVLAWLNDRGLAGTFRIVPSRG